MGVQSSGFQLNSAMFCCVTLGMLLVLSEPHLSLLSSGPQEEDWARSRVSSWAATLVGLS